MQAFDAPKIGLKFVRDTISDRLKFLMVSCHVTIVGRAIAGWMWVL
ncbi:MAG: hypothetical protein F6J86_43705 [Symploca sp. SIO1B1]|nr:hypothetical protein [Symploca sp. SIO1A3]NES00614.1 hypothetical protein [Symploca sp. SIO1B1]